jgi:hypothetical protein
VALSIYVFSFILSDLTFDVFQHHHERERGGDYMAVYYVSGLIDVNDSTFCGRGLITEVCLQKSPQRRDV